MLCSLIAPCLSEIRLTALAEILSAVRNASPAEREALIQEVMTATGHMRWVPNPGAQREAYESLADITGFGGEAGPGKGLSLDTELPTPSGFVRMGDVRVGDTLFDMHGQVCRVTALSPVNRRRTFRLEFDDGSSIIADDVHQWLTTTRQERINNGRLNDEFRAHRRAQRESRVSGRKSDRFTLSLQKRNRERDYALKEPSPGKVRSTLEILNTLKSSRQSCNHAIDVIPGLSLPDADLPVDPYTLGLWLGDGYSSSGAIGMAASDMDEVMTYVPYPVRSTRLCGLPKYKTPYRVVLFEGLQKRLRKAGLISNKHIPMMYLRASTEQRIALLQGLLDTDGHADRDGYIEIGLSDKRLADDVRELVCSLGIKTSLKVKKTAGADSHRMLFSAPFQAFRLKRKAEKQKITGYFRPCSRRRFIKAVTEVPSVPTRCIAVDSPTRTYLVGRTFIPTHNTALLVGLALSAHQRSLILRRSNIEAMDLLDEFEKITGTRPKLDRTNSFRVDGRRVQIGGCLNEDDKQKYKGRPNDFIGFDELTDFTRSQFEFIIQWNRSTVTGQRCRVVATFNPPTTASGLWVIEYFGPWLDPKHPRPAKSGEIRWFTTIDGRDTEVDGPGPHMVDGEPVMAKSRTFIRGRLEENVELHATGYDATRAAAPGALRRAYRAGDFEASLADFPGQCIPTAWVRAAQARWKPTPPAGIPMCAIGVDCSGGGEDPLVLAPRYDGYYTELIEVAGRELDVNRIGAQCAGIVVSYRRDGALIVVDLGGGYGGSIFERLKENGVEVQGHKGMEKSNARTADRKLPFFNKRSEVIWRFREALDPDQPGGSPIALPDDRQLVADLTTPSFEVTPRGIKVESKEDVCERLGRSTDRGDAVVMAWSGGARALTDLPEWMKASEEQGFRRRSRPKVIMGRRH